MPLYPPASSGGGAPTNSQYVTLALDAALSAERTLAVGTPGPGLTLADGGANNPVTISIANEVWTVLAADTTKVDNTLANLTGLTVPIAANSTEVWQFEVQLFLVNGAAGTTADFKFGWTFPAGVAGIWGAHNNTGAAGGVLWDHVAAASSGIAIIDISTAIAIGGLNSVSQGIFFRGTCFAGGTGGSLQLQWAQNTTNATAQTVKKGSSAIFRRLIA